MGSTWSNMGPRWSQDGAVAPPKLSGLTHRSCSSVTFNSSARPMATRCTRSAAKRTLSHSILVALSGQSSASSSSARGTSNSGRPPTPMLCSCVALRTKVRATQKKQQERRKEQHKRSKKREGRSNTTEARREEEEPTQKRQEERRKTQLEGSKKKEGRTNTKEKKKKSIYTKLPINRAPRHHIREIENSRNRK